MAQLAAGALALLQLAVEKQPARLEVIDPKQRLTWRTLDLSNFDLEGFDSDPLARLGLRLDRPDVAPIIGKVVPGSVAEAADYARETESSRSTAARFGSGKMS